MRSSAARKDRRIANKSVSMISILAKDKDSLEKDETKNQTVNMDLVSTAIAGKWTPALEEASKIKELKIQ